MIRVDGLRKQFRSGGVARRAPVLALDGMGWTAPDACITGLLGPNGAGKTSCLRIVAGLLVPDGGGAEVDGLDPAREGRAVRARLGVFSDLRGLYPRLSAAENIVYHGRLQGLPAAQAAARAQALAAQLGMQPLLERRTEGFSQGERMKTALARALVHDPPNLILDEPTNGLDVPSTRALREVLRRMRDEHGKCIVVSTHLMQEVERLCDRVVVVQQGRTVAVGSVAELNQRCGSDDFEQTFVQLAYGPASPGPLR